MEEIFFFQCPTLIPMFQKLEAGEELHRDSILISKGEICSTSTHNIARGTWGNCTTHTDGLSACVLDVT